MMKLIKAILDKLVPTSDIRHLQLQEYSLDNVRATIEEMEDANREIATIIVSKKIYKDGVFTELNLLDVAERNLRIIGKLREALKE
jgi:hypothetical protein